MNEETKSEFQKRVEKQLDDKNIMPPKRTPREKFIIDTIAWCLALPWLAVTMLGALAYGAFAWGYVLYKFWQWFVLPVFPALPHISISQGVGLMIVVQLFDKNLPQVLNEDLVDTTKKNIYDVIAPPIAFAFGWFVWYVLLPMGF